MENEKMMVVLTEILEDQKEIVRKQEQIIEAIAELKGGSEKMENSFKKMQNIVPAIDYNRIQQCIENGLAELKILMEINRQKAATNNLRVFLESDAKKWAVYLLVALTFLTYLYWFCMHK